MWYTCGILLIFPIFRTIELMVIVIYFNLSVVDLCYILFGKDVLYSFVP